MIFFSSHLFSHTLIHIAVLLPIGYFFVKKGHSYKKVILLLSLSFLVDMDHLLADPVYDPNRCGVGFHPLHQYWTIGVYVIGLFFKKTRIPASGFLAHMIVDWLDCF